MPIDSGTVSITGAGGWIQIGVLQLAGVKRGALVAIANTGANPLTHLKLTRGFLSGDHTNAKQKDWLVDADLNIATAELLDYTAGIQTLAAGATGFFKLANLEGVQEIGVYAQAGTTTTVQATGTAY